MKKIIFRVLAVLLIIHTIACILLFFFQERLIFFPEKLAPGFKFSFIQPFEELNIKMADDKMLNGILFKSDSSKGLIFYLHGNAGSLRNWGAVAKTYTDLHYDVFILDYRGYGKSEGRINGGQEQVFSDVQIAYDKLKLRYPEDRITVLGYSIGTGLAAKLASDNHPKRLILQAPYYSLTDMMRHSYPVVPTFLLKYKFETHRYLQQCKMPVVIFHGDDDDVIYYGSSLRLKQLFKPGDTLITLHGQKHNGITENQDYRRGIETILNR